MNSLFSWNFCIFHFIRTFTLESHSIDTAQMNTECTVDIAAYNVYNIVDERSFPWLRMYHLLTNGTLSWLRKYQLLNNGKFPHKVIRYDMMTDKS
jgi:hypothetical protein